MQNHRLCIECAKLQYDVVSILEKLIEIETVQLEAFRADDTDRFARLDRELELAVGEKERRVGALRQHRFDYHRVA
jgi:hypothetical protein